MKRKLLSPRQLEVLTLVVAGQPDKAIAFHLGLSHHTVRNTLAVIYDKLGVDCRVSAVVSAVRLEVISL